MRPAIAPGDWLLVDPTLGGWPRRGSVVVFREPMTDGLAIKRVAGRPGDRVPFAGGQLRLSADEAWLLGDASDSEALSRGDGRPVDSRRYGPVTLDRLVGRVWLRYAPLRRIGRIATGPPIDEVLARGITAPGPPPTAYGPVDIDALLAEERAREQERPSG
jgi:signal peptidase I